HHVGRHRRDDQQVDALRLDARLSERVTARRQRDVGERFLLRGEAPLTDAGALADPFVRRVDPLRELVVRDDAVRHLPAEPGDRDVPACLRFADHCPTNTVSIASAASSSPTSARPFPFAIGPRTRTNSHSSVSTSPGSTTRLKRQSSMPPKNGILPALSSCASTATAPHCAIASIVSTPGITGRSGK